MHPGLDLDSTSLERLRETYGNERLGLLLEDDRARGAVAAIAAFSPFLFRQLLSDRASFDTVHDLDTRQTPPVDPYHLAVWKRRELLRIAALDLIGTTPVETTADALAQLADDVLTTAHGLATNGTDCDIVIIGMGKLGGQELNYASDIDILFAGDCSDAIAREVMEIARRCFRVDAALRPEGRSGALVRTMESYRHYWQTWARPWEFQALLKARPIAGSADLLTAWSEAADEMLWAQTFDADAIRELRDMKARTEQLVARRGIASREVKRSSGGIRDIEFAAQLLQLVHGGLDATLRAKATLDALAALAEGGYIAGDDATAFSDAYRFLRNVEHRLQLVEDEQTHVIPNDRFAQDRLARSMGYRTKPEQTATDAFTSTLNETRKLVRRTHERIYFRPLLEAFTDSDMTPQGLASIESRLQAFGFTDAVRTRSAVIELTSGLARSSRLMTQMMPLLLDWLAESPDPDEGLLHLRRMISGTRTPPRLLNLFRDSPEMARRLCLLLGTSRIFFDAFVRHPEALADIADDDQLIPSESAVDRARHTLEWKSGTEERLRALRRFQQRELLDIAAADVIGIIDDSQSGTRRSQLADAVLQLALDIVPPPVPLAVVAAGRYGGDELAYGSDLDVILIHGGSGADDQQRADAYAQHLMRIIADPVVGRKMYTLDYSLRPEGKKGVLARSIEGCRQYYQQWAEVWERQALVRARFCAGSREVYESFAGIIQAFVWNSELSVDDVRTIRHIKARMERERLPRDEDPEFHLKLGKGTLSDVEWTVQLAQLQRHIPETNTLKALRAIAQSGDFTREDTRVLDEAWRFCDRTRNRLQLMTVTETNALPTQLDALSHLARSLDLSPAELRERYRHVTRRARRVMEERFYGGIFSQ